MSRSSRLIAAYVAALALGAGGGAGAATVVLDDRPDGDTTPTSAPAQRSSGTAVADVSTAGALTVNQIYRRARSSVVDITTPDGEGAGFVLDARGDIVTNEHVVGSAQRVDVSFADGRKETARVVGTDPSSDVAVIHVDPGSTRLKPLTFADSGLVKVGDPVVAIGSPYGLAGTVTTGVVSALDRSITSPSNYSISGALQTDAAINPGNSGGPLLDADGHVVGMNSQIAGGSTGNTGVGFAIAADTVRRIAQQLAAGKPVEHAYLGVELDGTRIAAIRAGGPAADAGAQAGDAVTAVDGRRVTSGDEIPAAIDARSPGDELTLTVRRGGAERKLSVTLGSRPS